MALMLPPSEINKMVNRGWKRKETLLHNTIARFSASERDFWLTAMDFQFHMHKIYFTDFFSPPPHARLVDFFPTCDVEFRPLLFFCIVTLIKPMEWCVKTSGISTRMRWVKTRGIDTICSSQASVIWINKASLNTWDSVQVAVVTWLVGIRQEKKKHLKWKGSDTY